ncbi:glycosyl hydrolase [Bifidobacterium choloepi]|uniref:Beta-mannosidase n=1 Tax=Bifidobacterium choloepi TaxID=2614131 RepID=A0A6I5N0G7_9BIFI|nr:glycosyl hydrolase [Bifidobacterium choloepi]NEG70398.1 beta-mannosidase [Bifidobacterium choloepi]
MTFTADIASADEASGTAAASSAATTALATTTTATTHTTTTPTTADPDATEETQVLFAKLQQTGKGGLRFGQQHAIDESISSTATNGDVYEMTGKYPAVMGWDAGLALTGDEKPGVSDNTTAQNAQLLADDIIQADADGAIVTLSAHWNNPATGGNYSDTTTVVADLLPGGDYSGTFNAMLDGIAAVANDAVRADGTQIPIIFRPLHENNGSWFWWGATHASNAEYIELYRYIVDYLRDVKGVHNLLFAYSPGGTFNGDATDYLATYPGDDFVDILGYDDYDTDNSSNDSSAWIATVIKDLQMISDVASARGKVVALTEFGRSGDRAFHESGTGDLDTAFFSELADAIAENVPQVAYMMTWANFGGSGSGFQAYTPWKGSDGEADFVDFANSNANLMASAANVDYTAAAVGQDTLDNIANAARVASARIVTPTDGSRFDDDNARDITVDPATGHHILTVRVKTENIAAEDLDLDPPTVTATLLDATTNGTGTDNTDIANTAATEESFDITLSYVCNGYLTGTLDLDAAGIDPDDGGKLALTAAVADTEGNQLADLNGTVTVKLGAATDTDVADVESFDGYDSDAELQAAYSPNNAAKASFTLTTSPDDGSQAGDLHYDFDSYPSYNGFQRSYSTKQDWSGYSALQMYLKPDGSDHLFVVQINAGGVTFEAYPDISGTDGGLVTLSFGDADGDGSDWTVASWDTANAGNSTSQQLLSQVGSFALYVNDNGGNRPRTGDLIIDAVTLTGERDPYVADSSATADDASDESDISDSSDESGADAPSAAVASTTTRPSTYADITAVDPSTCPITTGSTDSSTGTDDSLIGGSSTGNSGSTGSSADGTTDGSSATGITDGTSADGTSSDSATSADPSTESTTPASALANTGSPVSMVVMALVIALAAAAAGALLILRLRH